MTELKKLVIVGIVYIKHVSRKMLPISIRNSHNPVVMLRRIFEINLLKIIHPPLVVCVDENKQNIIQPIPLGKKSHRQIQAFVKEQDKKGEGV